MVFIKNKDKIIKEKRIILYCEDIDTSASGTDKDRGRANTGTEILIQNL